MALRHWRGQHLRAFQEVDCAFDLSINWFYGDNATGKTSLLEGLFYTVTGRSFRARDTRDIIHSGQDYCALHALFDAPEVTLDMVRYRNQMAQVRCDGNVVRKWSEIAWQYPVLFVDTHTHRQFAEQVEMRRKWFDWIMFHVKQSYAFHKNQYKKAQEQRMHALKKRLDPSPWENSMAEHGYILDRERKEIMADVQALLSARSNHPEAVHIVYEPGFCGDDLSGLWQSQREEDRIRGYASSGPHRFDVQASVDGQLYTKKLSLGQQKILVTDLMLVAVMIVQNRCQKNTLWLMDDVGSELDKGNMRYIVDRLQGLGLQSVITTLSKDAVLAEGSARPIESIIKGNT